MLWVERNNYHFKEIYPFQRKFLKRMSKRKLFQFKKFSFTPLFELKCLRQGLFHLLGFVTSSTKTGQFASLQAIYRSNDPKTCACLTSSNQSAWDATKSLEESHIPEFLPSLRKTNIRLPAYWI
jgi:hypothetical protein